MDTTRFNDIRSVYASSDGTVWVVWVDWGFGDARAPSWHAQRFSGSGARLSGDISLFPRQGMMDMTTVLPVGTTPDGSLVVDFERHMPHGEKRLAKIGANGSVQVSDALPNHFPGTPFVDRGGLAHLVAPYLSQVSYAQVNLNARGLPVVRSLNYDQPFGGHASAPEYLRWSLGARGRPIEIAFFGEGTGRIVVATGKDNPVDSFCNLYRVATKTLALVDSGSINLRRDVYRTWSGPAIPRTMIGQAGKSGYWIFAPTLDTPPAPTVVAYRIAPDLKVIHPTVVATDAAGPFAAAPAGAVVSLRLNWHRANARWENGVWVVTSKLDISFFAFDGDGRLYTQTFEDSITSRVTK